MRLSNLLPLALAVSPAVVSAAGTFGFAMGVKNADGSCKTQKDFEDDFDVLKAHTRLVRTYSASDCDNALTIIPAAKAKGFKVVLGIWYVSLPPSYTLYIYLFSIYFYLLDGLPRLND